MAIATFIGAEHYCDKESTDERTHYFLNLSDADPNDVVLYGILEQGKLKVAVPFVDKVSSTRRFLSEDISGTYLQALINEQFWTKRSMHRAYTQLREMREFADLEHRKFASIEELTFVWIEKGLAHSFARNYPVHFREIN